MMRRRFVNPTRRDRASASMAIRAAAVMLAAFVILQPAMLFAHGDTHEQIDELTKQIAGNSRDAALYVKRGELHRLHRDWNAAQADFDRAAQLDPKLPLVDLLRGKLLLEIDETAAAKLCLDRFLATRPHHIEALVTRARVFAKLRDAAAAAKDFSTAIARTSEPKPEYFLERAQALRVNPASHAEALRGLDEGIKQLGPLVTLELLAIELEVDAGKFDGALARVDQLGAQSNRQELWLAQRGEILLQAKRTAEAQATFAQAQAAIETLSISQRKAEAIVQLENRLRERIQVSTNSPVRAKTGNSSASGILKSAEVAATTGAE